MSRLETEKMVEDHQLKEKIVNEEYKIWKKTVPLLYDTIRTHVLEHPSLSVNWLPDYEFLDNKNYINVKFLISTNTSGKSQNYLKLGSIQLPLTLAPNFSDILPNADTIPIPKSPLYSNSELNILHSWKQSRELNVIKVSPDSKNLITFDGEGIIHLFNLNNFTQVDFKYHKLEGNSLEWVNPTSFLSGSSDSQIALWDISKPSTPIHLFKTHTGPINDLSKNNHQPSIFGSVSADHTTQFHDLRMAATNLNPAIKINNQQIQNSISFHPNLESIYVTGGKDNTVNLYDLRNPKIAIRTFYGHNDSIIGLKWDPNDPLSLVSWGLDRRVINWNLSNLNQDFTYQKSSENSRKRSVKIDPCLKFIHAGHVTRINDFDIHPIIKNLYATVGDDNLLEVWKQKSVGDVDDEVDNDENEES